MVSLYEGGIYLVNGTGIVPETESGKVKALTGREADKEAARKGTIAYSILEAHNTSDNMEHLKLRFDSMASHDIIVMDKRQEFRQDFRQRPFMLEVLFEESRHILHSPVDEGPRPAEP